MNDTTQPDLQLLAFVGSLRAASFSRKLLREASRLAPAGVTIREQSIGDLPHYNGDLEDDAERIGVSALRAAIADADGLLIITPEYNHGIPGVLKNAIDWASRPAFASVLARKPVAALTCSPGPVGGARAFAHLKSVLLGTLSEPLPVPDLTLGGVAKKFDEAGRLIDDASEARLTRLLADFAGWIRTRG